MGQSPPSSTYNNEKIGLPFFQGKADFGYISPKPRVWCSAPSRSGKQGDILMSVRAPVGDVNLASEKCALGRGVAAIRPSEGTNGMFLFYSLQFNKPRLVAASSGAIFESINKNTLHELELQLPPKPEQQKIAAVLWKVQRAIATQYRLIAATRDLKQSAMQHLFTHGLLGEPLKDTGIGPMPESWKVAALGDFGRIGNGSTPKKTTPEYWRNPTTPWLTSAKVHDGIIRSADQFVSDTAVKKCHLPIVPAGSLLIAITGQGKTLGNSALVEFDTTINQHLAYVRFDRKGVIPGYVYQYMRSRYEELQGIGRAGGSTKAALTCAFLRGYPVPLPPPGEQRDIAAALATLDRKLAHHQRKRAALNDLFQTTLHQLMTAQIRVADLDIDTSAVVE
ncbi:MAG: restriction endonuclease subunit S [Pseudomonas sp.]|nr:restriction endonuclease subunit S [Xanthomonadaceae bacterium]MDP2184831.1 restriction endonuclease subunit S [Xanthomonadales bacterium]MDZ4117166.1 restriction endonuclease subunit S [Xanthomonadaceae bacterium]MDZ4324520.1 restriction endonuclease subunit S [Pseudomonas sp.]